MRRKAPNRNPPKALLFNGLHRRSRNRCRGRYYHPRQAEKKGRAKPQFTLTANISAMGVHDVLGDRQPQSGSSGFARTCFVDAVEPLE